MVPGRPRRRLDGLRAHRARRDESRHGRDRHHEHLDRAGGRASPPSTPSSRRATTIASCSASASATGRRWTASRKACTTSRSRRWSPTSTSSTRLPSRRPATSGSSPRSARGCCGCPRSAPPARTRTCRSPITPATRGRPSGRASTSPPSRGSSSRRTRCGRASSRADFVERYLTLPNYFRQWLRYGFTEDDLRDGGSDRLVDALIAWGDEETIAARVQEHLDAGADHVCVQFIHDLDGLPTEQWRRMAEVLL